MRRGTNLPRMGDYNQTVVLDLIRRSVGGISRAALARGTGLSAQTISNITQRLIRDGLVGERGNDQHHGPGRPGTLVHLVARARFSIGVHIDPALITLTLLDLSGQVVRTEAEYTRGEADPERVIAQVVASSRSLWTDAGVDRSAILGIGIATPGPVDIERGVIVDPPLLSSWREVPLCDRITEVTGVPAVLDKEVNAAASAHLWYPHTRGNGGFVFVYFGVGIGIATVIGDEVVRGKTGNAGDVGRILVDHTGPATPDGMIGSLGTIVSGGAIVGEAVMLGIVDPGINLRNHAEVYQAVQRIAELADEGHELASRLVRTTTRRIMKAANDIAHLLELDRIILGGPLWMLWPVRELAAARAYANEFAVPSGLWEVSVETSSLGAQVGAIGAATVVLEQALAPRSSTLIAGT